MRFFIIITVAFFFCLSVNAQPSECIPEGKYDFYLNDFMNDCHNVDATLPYTLRLKNDNLDVKREYIVSILHTPFILDCNKNIQYYSYMTNPIYDYYMDADSLVLRQGSYRLTFSFSAVACFDYKDYMVVIYTYPLADPNYYETLTINTYAKDGKRIDRLPFFIWRNDLSVLEWGDNLDESWIELTGYIDENFEITTRHRTHWEDIHEEHGFRKEGMDEDTYNHLHEYTEYHVYNISDDGHFIEVQKEHKYEVDEKNNWTKITE